VLGTINFYRRFISGAAGILRLLTDPLQGSLPLNLAVEWSESRLAAFQQAAKYALATSTNLVHPKRGAELSLMAHDGGARQPHWYCPAAAVLSPCRLVAPGFLFQQAVTGGDQVLSI
jgi:hypothetical protein